MNKKLTITIIFFLMFGAFDSISQIYCPPNVDFEQGNLNNWEFFTGSITSTSIVCNTPTAAIANRHTLMSGTGTDIYGGFPIIPANSGNYVFKLGNNGTGRQAERARYKLNVPSGTTNYALLFKYAVVLQDPNHTSTQQPRLIIRMYDSATSSLLPCNSYTIVASSGLPGFSNSTFSGVIYKPWATYTINLTGYNGKKIYLDFTTTDCAQGGHFGYAYIDMGCDLYQIGKDECYNGSSTSLKAPEGFDTYKWYNFNFTNLLGTNRILNQSVPSTTSVYKVIVKPFAGYGCTDTLSTTLFAPSFSSMTMSFTNPICQGDTSQVNVTYTGTAAGISWSNTGFTSCSNCYTPKIFPPSNYISQVKVTDASGVCRIDTLRLTVNPKTFGSINQTICQGNSLLFNNISRTVSGIYLDTFVNAKGCDSILTLNLTVNPKTFGSINQTICQGTSFLFNNISRTVSGTYLDTFVNEKGCDSILTLNLTVNPKTFGSINQTICQGTSFLFNNISRSVSGAFLDTLVNAKGCDSFLVLNLTVNDTTRKDSFRTICKNQSVLFNGISLNTSGVYRDTFVNAAGCDSFIYLILTVNDTTRKDSFRTICKNQSVVFNGVSLNTSGVYRDTFVNSKGCDSFLYLILTVNDTSRKDSFRTICKNQFVVFNGVSLNTSGVYRDTFVNSKGCDSFLYLILTVNDTTRKDSFRTICKNQPLVFNGQTLNTSGVYRDTFVNARGCDSFIYLILSIRDTSFKILYDTTCRNYPKLFNGSNLNVSGLYRDTLVNSEGCDSFIYYNLLVKDTTKKDSFLTICRNQPVIFNNISRNSTGVYKDTLVNTNGCDSFLYLHLTVKDTTKKDSFLSICRNKPIVFNGWTFNTAGTYKDTLVNSVGCDSFMYLHLTIRDTSYKILYDTTCRNLPKLFNGSNLNITGLYRDTLVNAVGCDSFIYYNLFVKDTTKKDSFLTICKNQLLVFNGISRNNTGIYKDTLVNTQGCDSFVYLHLKVKDTTKKDSFLTICKNQPVIFNGIARNSTGIYNDTLVNSIGCDSFMYLHLTVKDTTKKDSFLTICRNQPVAFNGWTLNTAGTYKDTLDNVVGCDSFIYLHLSIRDTSYKILYDTTCRNLPKLFNGSNLNITGLYRDTLVNAVGCDSFIYYNLFVKDTTKKDSFLTICKNQLLVFNGISRNNTGIYKDTLVNTQGCDSFVYLHLKVKDTTKKDSFLTICRNQPVIFNNISRNITGVYKDTLVNTNGCDSFLYLHLTVKDTTKKDSFLSICRNKPIVFNGWTFNTAGTYKDTLVNSVGCDSFMYLHLTIRDTSFKILYDTTCRNYPKLFNGSNLYVTGLYRDTLVNAVGCDSFVYYNLYVKDTTKKDSFLTICKNQLVIFNGISRNNTGIYKDTLVNTQGCDSFIYLHLKVITPYTVSRDTDVCYSYTHRGILYNSNSTILDTIKSIHGCDSVYKMINLSIFKPTKGQNDSIVACEKAMYQGSIFNRDTSFSANISKTIFPFCDSIIKLTKIKIHPLPIVKIYALPDTFIKYGEKITLRASGGQSYLWNYNSSNQTMIESIITDKTYFEVKVTDNNLCETIAGQWIYVNPEVEIIDVFSPNADGRNDNFAPNFKGITVLSFKIYNRWGQIIYQTADQNPSWDGRFKGEIQPQGSYVYMLEYTANGQKFSKTGAITLIH
jgi:gliding motility-associated-like protein